jgi:hypothetical protein
VSSEGTEFGVRSGRKEALTNSYNRPETGGSFQVGWHLQAATWMIKPFTGHH